MCSEIVGCGKITSRCRFPSSPLPPHRQALRGNSSVDYSEIPLRQVIRSSVVVCDWKLETRAQLAQRCGISPVIVAGCCHATCSEDQASQDPLCGGRPCCGEDATTAHNLPPALIAHFIRHDAQVEATQLTVSTHAHPVEEYEPRAQPRSLLSSGETMVSRRYGRT